MSTLFIDLETVPADDNFSEQDLRSVIPMSVKKEETINRYLTEKKDELISKLVKKHSLDPLLCKVVCLSYCFEDEQPQSITGKEQKIFEIFQNRIDEHLEEKGGSVEGIIVVGHNFKKFDGPIIYLRACKYNLQYVRRLVYGRKSIKDTMEIAAYNVYGQMLSLNRLCEYFGIESPKEEMDGSMVYQNYKEGNIEDISKYCNKDVEALVALYDKLT